ncbi:hypothetical protein [Streptomyces sp. NPDC001250]|uniref:hypothetical protein n=1 Tax=unclassified Streptomyces TaxID=2593676 RepID=UPI003317842B
MNLRGQNKRRHPNRSRRVVARGSAVAALMAGLAGYAVTAAPAASAACNPGFGGYLGRCETTAQQHQREQEEAQEFRQNRAKTCEGLADMRNNATDADTFFASAIGEEAGDCPESFRAQLGG